MELIWDWPTAWPFLIPTAVILLALLCFNHLSRRPAHPQEPPIVPCPLPIPYIGHLIFMAAQGGHYIRSLGLAHGNLPIFTLVVPFGRMYIVTSPGLTNAIQRKPTRELSSNAILPDVVTKIMGLDDETRDIAARGIDAVDAGKGKRPGPGLGQGQGLEGQRGVLEDLHGLMVTYLGVGRQLDELMLESVRALVAEVDGFLDGFGKRRAGGVSISTSTPTVALGEQDEDGEDGEGGGSEHAVQDLLPWVRRLVIRASARVLYGSRNPFAMEQRQQQQQQQPVEGNFQNQDGSDLETDFWAWDYGLGKLLIGIWPSVTAREPYHARERLVEAFRAYIDGGHYDPERIIHISSKNNGSGSSNGNDNDNDNANANANDTSKNHKPNPVVEKQDQQRQTGAAPIVLNRIRIARAHGFSSDGIARSELSFLFAAMVNTAAVAFWTLLRCFADRELLAAVKEELVENGVVSGGGDENEEKRYLSLAALTSNKYAACQTLHAVFQEVLRLGSNNFSTRLVQEDTYIMATSTGGKPRQGQKQVEGEYEQEKSSEIHQYFLQKGGIVQIAGGVMHLNRSLWGEDAEKFRPGRHLIKDKTTTTITTTTTTSTSTKADEDNPAANENPGSHRSSTSTTTRTSAFRGFGGGKTICPGRYFATAEILGFVAYVVLQMEIEGAHAEGQKTKTRTREREEEDAEKLVDIKVPELDDYILPVHILEPAPGKAVMVKMRRRKGAAGGKIEVVP